MAKLLLDPVLSEFAEVSDHRSRIHAVLMEPLFAYVNQWHQR